MLADGRLVQRLKLVHSTVKASQSSSDMSCLTSGRWIGGSFWEEAVSAADAVVAT